MFKYGLKLWSSNVSWFAPAAQLCASKQFDFVELYYNPSAPLDFEQLVALKGFVYSVHSPHSHGWHEFFIAGPHHLEQWQQTTILADYFTAQHIVLHPCREHTIPIFEENYAHIKDPRVIIENMAGRDIDGQVMGCGQTMQDMRQLRALAPICFDIEKGIKAAVHQGVDYKEFITIALAELQPDYMHLSGGDRSHPMDQHLNLWEANFDWPWIKNILTDYARSRDVRLVLEVPKVGDDLGNDVRNLEFFKSIAPISY